MRIEDCVFDAGPERLAATKIYSHGGGNPSVISFHGFGPTASRMGIRYVLDYLAEHDVSSACFDFSGNGDSTRNAHPATLNGRKREAYTAAKELGRPEGSLTIIGTSMGAYLAALLVPELEPSGLVLFCPVAYPQEAMDLKLDDDFPTKARRLGPDASSPAFQALSNFKGKLLIVAAGKDTVAPRNMTNLYAEKAPLAKSKKIIWLEESEHKAHIWLQQHKEERDYVLREVLAITREE